ncbi:MAG: tRNA pseudouridine(55) synthase TruB [Candidatus Omnitrophica bacterium]|nr:tRNA pseudouridine(55) synthase TruB [Candidatus Omnitrophota bacterium]
MKTNQKDGILLINKAPGLTSHDVVDIARKKLGIRKIGHAGTLDPLAEGLLILLVGKSTKLFSKFVGFDKEYLGIMKLGEITSTGDSEGEILESKDPSFVTEDRLREVFSSFEGQSDQIPPMVSAVRVGGKRLYELARRGIEVERKPRQIQIYNLEIMKIEFPLIEFKMHCSKGTYVRKFAEDIGAKLECGAHMLKIKRLKIGTYSLDQAHRIDDINESHLRKFTLEKN